MRCKFPDKECTDNYWAYGKKKRGKYCRLFEWKRKRGICPYDKMIQSHTKIRPMRMAKGQLKLEKFK